MCGIKPAHAQQFLGQWVHCHSVYGVHRGVLTRVLPNGIVLHHAMRLASAAERVASAEPALLREGALLRAVANTARAPQRETPLAQAPPDIQPVQFFGGFFIPFGGVYGLWPWFGFGFAI